MAELADPKTIEGTDSLVDSRGTCIWNEPYREDERNSQKKKTTILPNDDRAVRWSVFITNMGAAQWRSYNSQWCALHAQFGDAKTPPTETSPRCSIFFVCKYLIWTTRPTQQVLFLFKTSWASTLCIESFQIFFKQSFIKTARHATEFPFQFESRLPHLLANI